MYNARLQHEWSAGIRRQMESPGGGVCRRPGYGFCGYVDPDSSYLAPRCLDHVNAEPAGRNSICCKPRRKRSAVAQENPPPKFQVDEKVLRPQWDVYTRKRKLDQVVRFGQFRKTYLQYKPHTSERIIRSKYFHALQSVTNESS